MAKVTKKNNGKGAIAMAKAKVKKAGSKDMSHVARVINKGWRKGSVCFYIQQHLDMSTEKIAKALMKDAVAKNQACFSTMAKACARVNTIKAQAKMLGIRKAR